MLALLKEHPEITGVIMWNDLHRGSGSCSEWPALCALLAECPVAFQDG